MTREEALNILTNVASLLRDGTRFLKQEHEEQFHKAYEMAMDALRQPEIIRCKNCRYNAELAEYIKDYYGCDYHEHIVRADGFCDNAKRREEGNE